MACVATDDTTRRQLQSLMVCRSLIACRSTCLKELSSSRATHDTTATSVSKEHDTLSHNPGHTTDAQNQSHAANVTKHTSESSTVSAVASESACARELRTCITLTQWLANASLACTCDDQHRLSSPLHGRAPVGLRHCAEYKADS